MADDADRADALQEISITSAVAQVCEAAAKAPTLTPAGYCLNDYCGMDFGPQDAQRLFCGPKCEREHARLSGR